MNGTILTEHQLNTSRGPQTPKRTSKSLHNQVGWKKDEGIKKRRRSRTGPVPWGGRSWRRGEVPTPGEALSPMGRSVKTEGEIQELSEESAATGLWQAGQGETYTDSLCHSPVWDVCPPVQTGAGSWNVGFGEQIGGENCCWLWGDGLRYGSEEVHNRECLWRKPRQA